MAKRFEEILPEHRDFIARQRIFFTATATDAARVNVSPRPTDCLRVLDDHTVCYLDRTGSGNETAAHLRADGRMTIMFCAFEGPPRIVRLYGTGRTILRGEDEYANLLGAHFVQEIAGARQIVMLSIDLVQTSCGYGVPLFDYRGERTAMQHWTENKIAEGPGALGDYQRANNVFSIDGLPTGLFD